MLGIKQANANIVGDLGQGRGYCLLLQQSSTVNRLMPCIQWLIHLPRLQSSLSDRKLISKREIYQNQCKRNVEQLPIANNQIFIFPCNSFDKSPVICLFSFAFLPCTDHTEQGQRVLCSCDLTATPFNAQVECLMSALPDHYEELREFVLVPSHPLKEESIPCPSFKQPASSFSCLPILQLFFLSSLHLLQNCSHVPNIPSTILSVEALLAQGNIIKLLKHPPQTQFILLVWSIYQELLNASDDLKC